MIKTHRKKIVLFAFGLRSKFISSNNIVKEENNNGLYKTKKKLWILIQLQTKEEFYLHNPKKAFRMVC